MSTIHMVTMSPKLSEKSPETDPLAFSAEDAIKHFIERHEAKIRLDTVNDDERRALMSHFNKLDKIVSQYLSSLEIIKSGMNSSRTLKILLDELWNLRLLGDRDWQDPFRILASRVDKMKDLLAGPRQISVPSMQKSLNRLLQGGNGSRQKSLPEAAQQQSPEPRLASSDKTVKKLLQEAAALAVSQRSSDLETDSATEKPARRSSPSDLWNLIDLGLRVAELALSEGESRKQIGLFLFAVAERRVDKWKVAALRDQQRCYADGFLAAQYAFLVDGILKCCPSLHPEDVDVITDDVVKARGVYLLLKEMEGEWE